MSNPVVHFEIIGTDGLKLRDFYQGVFDPIEYLYGESIVLDEAHRLAGGQPLYAPPTARKLKLTCT